MTLVSVCVHFLKLLDTQTQKWTQSLTIIIYYFVSYFIGNAASLPVSETISDVEELKYPPRSRIFPFDRSQLIWRARGSWSFHGNSFHLPLSNLVQDSLLGESHPPQIIPPDIKCWRLFVGRSGKRHSRVPSRLSTSAESCWSAVSPPVTTITRIK